MSTLSPTFRRTIGAATALLALSSTGCTSLLGDDFSVRPSVAAGGAGQAGATMGGSGGLAGLAGSGTSGAPPLVP